MPPKKRFQFCDEFFLLSHSLFTHSSVWHMKKRRQQQEKKMNEEGEEEGKGGEERSASEKNISAATIIDKIIN
jgi:hypothetical protein